MGKHKIGMQRISDKQKRHVAFSKRRKGLFKKAEDLCSLTGATIAIICFSEAGNPFTLCYPHPTESRGGDDDRQGLLSVMQQFYAQSDGSTMATGDSQPANVGEPKSNREYQIRTVGLQVQQSEPNNEMMSTSIEPLHVGGMKASDPDPGCREFWPASSWVGGDEQEMVQPGRLQSMHETEVALLDSVLGESVEKNLMESSSCGFLDSASTSDFCYSWLSPPPSPSSSSLGFNGNLDFLEMEAKEGEIIPSPSFFFLKP